MPLLAASVTSSCPPSLPLLLPLYEFVLGLVSLLDRPAWLGASWVECCFGMVLMGGDDTELFGEVGGRARDTADAIDDDDIDGTDSGKGQSSNGL
jgi:hypothetical protein